MCVRPMGLGGNPLDLKTDGADAAAGGGEPAVFVVAGV